VQGITNGTVAANKAMVVDANKDISGGRNLTISGELDAATLDISGNIDIDGISNLDVVDVDGAANFAADVTFADGADIITASAGTSNLRLGVNAGNSIQSGGNFNVTVGDEAGTAITTADANSLLGYQAGAGNIAGADLTAIGFKAGVISTGAFNTFVGKDAGLVNTAGTLQTFVGEYSGRSTTGSNNTFFGQQAGTLVTSGTKNTIIGRFNGNHGGLDIRTSSNNIVISDGDGNPRIISDSSGNLLVGKTGNLAGARTLVAGTKSGTNGTNGQLVVLDEQAYSTTDNGGGISFAGNFYSGGQIVFATVQGVKANNTDSNNAGALKFTTKAHNANQVEAMRIDGGNVLVGKTSAAAAGAGLWLYKNGTDYGRINFGSSHTGTSFPAIFYNNSGNEAGSISYTTTATSYNTSSDYRLKTDAQPMTSASARVLALKPVNFQWISDGSRTDGFLAHEAQAVVPECVTGTKDAMQDKEYQVSAATGDIYTPATDAYVDEDGNNVDAVEEVIHSADVEEPKTLADGQQWRETTPAVMGTRSVPDMQGIDQSKMVPLLTAALQEALARITALENA